MNPVNAVAIDTPARRNRVVATERIRPEKPSARTEPDLFDAPTSILIVGLDDRERPHASRFAVSDGKAAVTAAAMMSMTTITVQSPALAELAAKLPAGKLFASGKAFVPFVGHDLYRRLEAYLPIARRAGAARPASDMAKDVRSGGKSSANDTGGEGKGSDEAVGTQDGAGSATAEQNKYADAKATKTPRSGKYPEDWDKIAVGHIVLASAERDDGWWTAHVREVKADGTYLLEWEEWTGFPKFTCRREQIALLHPDYDGK